MSLSERFVKPNYDASCFSNIPSNIEGMLGPEKEGEYKKAVFIFVDAFGWKFFEENKDKYPSLQRFVNSGTVSKITSQFPSTTAAHVTTINTGLPVGESGVYEWFYYEPKLDTVIAPLLFSIAGSKTRGVLDGLIDPKEIYPTETFYQRLKKYGIKSSTYVPAEFANSPYNQVVTNGADLVFPYESCPEGLLKIADDLIEEKGKAYYFYYYPKVDTMGHSYGPNSKYFQAEIDLFFTALERSFLKVLEGKAEDTVVLLSADHGQVNVDPKTTIYINREIENIANYFKTTKDGRPITPGGSCRDMFLYVKEDKVKELVEKLRNVLGGKAEVYETQKLIEEGYFGKRISETFLSRVGNIVILPFSGESVWWYEEGIFEQKHFGHHGGLTPEEMEIPLLKLTF